MLLFLRKIIYFSMTMNALQVGFGWVFFCTVAAVVGIITFDSLLMFRLSRHATAL